MVHDIRDIVADAGGLLYIDEEEQTVHYVHQSVQSHLFDSHPPHNGFSAEELDRHLGFLVLTYLNFSDFNRSLIKANVKPSLSFRPLDIPLASLTNSSNYPWRAAQKLLRNRVNLQQLKGNELERRIQETVGTVDQTSSQLEMQYPFLDYAKMYWLDHLDEMDSKSDPRMWSRFRKLFEAERGLTNGPCSCRLKDQLSTNSSSWIDPQYDERVQKTHQTPLTLHQLVHSSEMFKNSDLQQIHLKQILAEATEGNLFLIMNILMSQHVLTSDALEMAVDRAIELGLADCVDLSIQQGFDPNRRKVSDRDSPLQKAIRGGRLEIAQSLINANADVNAILIAGQTILQFAVTIGDLAAVNMLIVAGSDVNAASEARSGPTALQVAAYHGHLKVLERLIAAKADVNAAPAYENGRTALQAAAENGYHEIVESLLTAGAEVNAAPAQQHGRTALQAAAENGLLKMTDRLLDAGADVDAAPGLLYGRTALQAAAENGLTMMTIGLLDARADVNAAPGMFYGRTALQAAAEKGHLDMIGRLIDAGADVNAAPRRHGRTALYLAASTGHLAIVDSLIGAGADVNAAPSEYKRTALQEAVEKGHINVAERLKKAGARR